MQSGESDLREIDRQTDRERERERERERKVRKRGESVLFSLKTINLVSGPKFDS